MLEIVILSGKGGTGKTTVATNLALSLKKVQLLDADVEEPNDYIFLNPDFKQGKEEIVYRKIPAVDNEKCTACRKCVDFCQYNALALFLDKINVFPEICHSCGGCKLVCSQGAIIEKYREVGIIKGVSINKNLEFWQGELNIGEESAVPVIKQLKKHIVDNKNIIIDAQPGTTCPTIAATIDSDYCILVTEPTPFGLSDLKRAVNVIRELKIYQGVIINRADKNYNYIIEDYCKRENLSVLLKIPYKREIAELYSKGIPFVKEMPEWKNKFSDMFNNLLYAGASK